MKTQREIIGEALHNAGLNVYTHPSSNSMEEWVEYRLKIADGLIERGVHLTAAEADTEQLCDCVCHEYYKFRRDCCERADKHALNNQGGF